MIWTFSPQDSLFLNASSHFYFFLFSMSDRKARGGKKSGNRSGTKRVCHSDVSNPVKVRTPVEQPVSAPGSGTLKSSESHKPPASNSCYVYEKDFICSAVKETIGSVIGDSWYSVQAMKKWPDLVSEILARSLAETHGGNRYIGSLLCIWPSVSPFFSFLFSFFSSFFFEYGDTVTTSTLSSE